MRELRTTIRPAGAGDAELVARLSAQAGGAGLVEAHPDDAAAVASAIREGAVGYFITLDRAGTPVGVVEWRWVGARAARCAHLGVLVADPGLWTLGYGAESVDDALEELFYTHGAHRVEFMTASSNHQMVSMLARGAGPVVDGILRDYLYADGRHEDAVLWSVLRPEFDLASAELCDRVERRRQADAAVSRSQRRLVAYLRAPESSSLGSLPTRHVPQPDEEDA